MTTPRWKWIAIALGSVLAAGCGKKDDGPPCTQVAEHVNEIVSKAYPGHGDMMPASDRKTYVQTCEAHKLTGKQRRCMVEAKSVEALAACLPQDQGGKADEKKPGPAAPPAPAAPSATPPAAPAAPPATPPATPAPAAPAPAAPPAAPAAPK
jgi:hypothetical protein